jgi:RNA polymerase sigma factor (sigma-70 family)
MKTMEQISDADLVANSLGGDRQAFGAIVGRYQSLICSMAFSATGSLTQSEDLAQETFVTGWKQLRQLREPAKLRSWLCGIARNIINTAVRKQGRDPAAAAEPLEHAETLAAEEPAPAAHAISREEEAILWRSIERIPETYREVLVLFYREHQSIQQVAQALDLTEDAVKQRLARGRKLLHAEVKSFVEGALARTNPGKAFTIGVLAALPGFAVSAQAATAGVAAAKTGAKAATAGAAGLFGAVLSPLLALFGTWVGYRMSLDGAQSDDERQQVRSFYRKLGACIAGFFICYAAVVFWGGGLAQTQSLFFTALILGLVLSYTVALVAVMIWSQRQRRKLLDRAADRTVRPAWEYRSRFRLCGLPFVHVRVGGGLVAEGQPVKAWIAVGDCAVGVLFSFGGIAVAPISIGGLSIGLIPFGGCALGLLGLGGTSLAIWSFGGLAIGWEAFGGCAVAWKAAVGGMAVARDYALGGIAQAVQANNDIAAAFARDDWFFSSAQVLFRYLAWLNLVWVVPMLWWWTVTRRGNAARSQPLGNSPVRS